MRPGTREERRHVRTVRAQPVRQQRGAASAWVARDRRRKEDWLYARAWWPGCVFGYPRSPRLLAVTFLSPLHRGSLTRALLVVLGVSWITPLRCNFCVRQGRPISVAAERDMLSGGRLSLPTRDAQHNPRCSTFSAHFSRSFILSCPRYAFLSLCRVPEYSHPHNAILWAGSALHVMLPVIFPHFCHRRRSTGHANPLDSPVGL